MPEYVAVGVDATPDGWVAVRYHDREYATVHRYVDDEPEGENETQHDSAFAALWRDHDDADCVLVDVPIGLPADDPAREPEVEARAHLEHRHSSVFNVPIRSILDAEDYATANEAQKERADTGLMQQTFNITHRIRKVDALLRDTDVADATQDRIREAHPEVCFWALDEREDMRFSKSSQPAAAYWERVGVLAATHNHPDRFHDALATAGRTLLDWPDPRLSNDDLLDAFALAVTASPLTGDLQTLPETPGEDEMGLRMEMVYAPPR
jgi:predicted RNase H-like nuclease